MDENILASSNAYTMNEHRLIQVYSILPTWRLWLLDKAFKRCFGVCSKCWVFETNEKETEGKWWGYCGLWFEDIGEGFSLKLEI